MEMGPRPYANRPLTMRTLLSAVALSSPSQLIDLCRQHEIAFRKSVNLMGPDRNLGLTPAKANVRVVTLLLGKFTDTIDERQRLAKILESKRLQQVMLAHSLAIRQLAKQSSNLIAFQRRHAAPARHALAVG